MNTAARAHLDGHHRRTDRPLITFLVAAYLFPWTVWGSQIANDHGWISWHLPGGIALWTLVPVTLAATAMNNETQGLRDHWRRLTRWRVPLRWYAAATLIPLSVAVLATVAGVAETGGAHFGETIALPAAAGYLVYGLGLFLLTEESAWRGFALPRLMTHASPLTASIVLGVIWAGWHLPALLLSSESDSTIPYSGFAVMTVATSVITAWLYIRSGGSVPLCALFHTVADATYAYCGVVGHDHHAFWVAVALNVLLAAFIGVVVEPTQLSRRRSGR